MDAEILFHELEGNAWKLAVKSTLDVDDIRQEMYLLCMEVAEGRSSYSPLVGGVQEYIMGRLWGFIRKWPLSQSLDDLIGEDVDDDKTILLTEFRAPSSEDVLIRKYELFEHDVRDIEKICQMRERTRNQSILVTLVQNGYWSIREAAKFCGVTQNVIQKKMLKAQSRPNDGK